MLGRAALVQCIENHLSKPTPDHVSVVGRKHYGKSVLLRHLANVYRAGSDGYLTTVHIDLRHDTPGSDGAFKRRLAAEVKAALRAKEVEAALRPERTELSEYIDLDDAAIHESLDLVFTELEGESARILVVLDGFDYAFAGTELTRNLWDQLRSLAQRTSLRFVTGSRRPLRELCRTEESRTSDFWGIFYDTPVRVTALDDSDWGAFLQPLLDAGCTFDEPARKEIANWTGGVPLLVCVLLQELWEKYRGAALSKLEIDRTAEEVLIGRREILADLWDDCDVELRADLGTLAGGDIPLSDLSDNRRRAIEDRGFGRVSKRRLRGSCRLIQCYAKEQAPALADLTRIFGTSTGFKTQIRSFMELRLAQVTYPDVDEDLRRFVSNAIRDLEPHPEDALTWIRSVADRTLTLIWEAELPPDKVLPEEWIEEWRHRGVTNLPEDRGKLPRGTGAQCRVLRLITDSDLSTSRQSKYVTKTTYLLVDHLKSVGDFGQHRGDYPETTISVGFAATVVLAAISLVENLTADLRREE